MAALLVVLAAGCPAQEGPDASLSAPPADLLSALPLDVPRRSALRQAIAARQYDVAENLLAEESAKNPASQPLLLALANVLFLDGKPENSALVLKKAERIGPLDERSRFLLALSYVAIRRSNLAVPELESLSKTNPSNAVYLYWLSRMAYRKMNHSLAAGYAERAVKLDPAYLKAHDQLGLCYVALNRNEGAILEFNEAIRLNQQRLLRWPWPSMNLGTLYSRMNRLDEAEAALRQSLSIESCFPVAHFRLARVLEMKEHWEEAVAELKEAARCDPTYPEPHYALARMYRKRNDPKAALDELGAFENLRKADKLKGIVRPD